MNDCERIDVFISYSWVDFSKRDMLIAHLRNHHIVSPIYDARFVSDGEPIAESVRGKLGDSHVVLCLFTLEAAKSEWVLEELTRADALRIPYYLIVSNNAVEKLPRFAKGKKHLLFDEAEEVIPLIEKLVETNKAYFLAQRTVSQYRQCGFKIADFLSRQKAIRQTAWKRNFRLAQSMATSLLAEIDTLGDTEYEADINEKFNFIWRAQPVFETASKVLAISIDEVSGFWTPRSRNVERYVSQYIEHQPQKTQRLFVFHDQDALVQHCEILRHHHESYGRSGGVYVCSYKTYYDRVWPEMRHKATRFTRDFAILWYDRGNKSEINVATLDLDHFVLRTKDQTNNNANVVIENVRSFFDELESLNIGDMHPDYSIVRWNADAEFTDELAESIFGSSKRCLHTVGISRQLSENPNFRPWLGNLRKVATDSAAREATFEIRAFKAGASMDHIAADGETDGAIKIKKNERWPFVIVFDFPSQEDMKLWYGDPQHSRLRRELYSMISDEVVEFYAKIDDATDAEDRAQIYSKIEEIARKHLMRYDYTF